MHHGITNAYQRFTAARRPHRDAARGHLARFQMLPPLRQPWGLSHVIQVEKCL
jgi:hypothetical protein